MTWSRIKFGLEQTRGENQLGHQLTDAWAYLGGGGGRDLPPENLLRFHLWPNGNQSSPTPVKFQLRIGEALLECRTTQHPHEPGSRSRAEPRGAQRYC